MKAPPGSVIALNFDFYVTCSGFSQLDIKQRDDAKFVPGIKCFFLGIN